MVSFLIFGLITIFIGIAFVLIILYITHKYFIPIFPPKTEHSNSIPEQEAHADGTTSIDNTHQSKSLEDINAIRAVEAEPSAETSSKK